VKKGRSEILYLHEINQVRPGRLNAFLDAVEHDYLAIAERLGIRMVGYWTVPPGHGSWPETVAVWELDGYEHHVDITRARLDPSRYDEGLRGWDANVGEWVTRSEGMVCLPSSMTPTVAQIKERGLKAKMCTHELIHNEPGRQEEYLRIVEEFYFKRVASLAGRSIVGLYWSPWKNTRTVCIWGQGEEWDTVYPRGKEEHFKIDDESAMWKTLGLQLRKDWDDRWIVPTSFSTVR
jgi:hypothetical protein